MTAHLSARSANHLRTPVKSYPLLRDCFSPARIPGVSSNVTLFNTEERVVEHSNLNVLQHLVTTTFNKALHKSQPAEEGPSKLFELGEGLLVVHC